MLQASLNREPQSNVTAELIKRVGKGPILTRDQKVDQTKVDLVEPAEQFQHMDRAYKTKWYWRDSFYLLGETFPPAWLTLGKGKFWPLDGGFYRTKQRHIDRWCITGEISERNIRIGKKEWES